MTEDSSFTDCSQCGMNFFNLHQDHIILPLTALFLCTSETVDTKLSSKTHTRTYVHTHTHTRMHSSAVQAPETDAQQTMGNGSNSSNSQCALPEITRVAWDACLSPSLYKSYICLYSPWLLFKEHKHATPLKHTHH